MSGVLMGLEYSKKVSYSLWSHFTGQYLKMKPEMQYYFKR